MGQLGGLGRQAVAGTQPAFAGRPGWSCLIMLSWPMPGRKVVGTGTPGSRRVGVGGQAPPLNPLPLPQHHYLPRQTAHLRSERPDLPKAIAPCVRPSPAHPGVLLAFPHLPGSSSWAPQVRQSHLIPFPELPNNDSLAASSHYRVKERNTQKNPKKAQSLLRSAPVPK